MVVHEIADLLLHASLSLKGFQEARISFLALIPVSHPALD